MSTDWSEEPDDSGCCLNCFNAEEGCLCYACKCRQCSWYKFDQIEGKGYCSKINNGPRSNVW